MTHVLLPFREAGMKLSQEGIGGAELLFFAASIRWLSALEHDVY